MHEGASGMDVLAGVRVGAEHGNAVLAVGLQAVICAKLTVRHFLQCICSCAL